jgi:A/G-specific adenine glycosylase
MTKKEEVFIEIVWTHYKREGRRHLPWRKTRDPYRILVSEIMCQQTQVDRVIPKYKAFLKQFPTAEALSNAPLGEVLRAWQGLGYNRRAKMLHECAKKISREYNGKFPKDIEALKRLPGIGPYTAGAVAGFAFNTPVPIIETNIRSAILHHFFSAQEEVNDREVMKYVERTLPLENAREWYAALMDYGSHLKKTYGNPNSRSKHYVKQSVFKGSDRQIRGVLLRHLMKAPATRIELLAALAFEDIRIDAQLMRLKEEGLLRLYRGKYTLPH